MDRIVNKLINTPCRGGYVGIAHAKELSIYSTLSVKWQKWAEGSLQRRLVGWMLDFPKCGWICDVSELFQESLWKREILSLSLYLSVHICVCAGGSNSSCTFSKTKAILVFFIFVELVPAVFKSGPVIGCLEWSLTPWNFTFLCVCINSQWECDCIRLAQVAISL